MADDKGIGLSFVMMFVTALVIVGVMEAVSTLIGPTGGAKDNSEAALLERIRPVGQLNLGAAMVAGGATTVAAGSSAPTAGTQTEKTAARSGDQVFQTVCHACHGTGVAGAPKVGDKGAWSPRIKQGMEVLFSHATHGFTGKSGMMPPRGTCGNCSDAELKNAVEYMVSKSK